MQTFIGTVTSIKMKNTLAVVVPYSEKHPKYLKVIQRKTNLLVHSDIEGIKEGDKVRIVKSRPYSKLKHFKVLEKLG